MIKLGEIRKYATQVIICGSHPHIIQSILDYDFLIKKQEPSIFAIIASGRKHERYFWGETEVVIPVVGGFDKLTDTQRERCTAVVNVQSARRVLSSTVHAIDTLPNLKMVTVFAEQTPESHSLQLIEYARQKDVLLIGPSSVGLLVPGHIKLGPIGGTQHQQLSTAGILMGGDTAVISTSGGVVNELVHTVTGAGLGVSFAIALGGDRFPMTSPAEAMLLAENDKQTGRIVYFGELGGSDEYEIAALIKDKKITKTIITYIAGTVAELFENPPQFGHAKALAQTYDESAAAKKKILKECGVVVCENFATIETKLRRYSTSQVPRETRTISDRQRSLIVSHISGDKNGDVQLLGDDLLTTIDKNSIASLILSMLLGHPVTSKKMINFIDYAFRLLVDHGPYVSGAINTIITARAGRDLVSGLTAGLLTIGPRFGGAINAAAEGWLRGVSDGTLPREFVNAFTGTGGVIPGIGHKKYRVDAPDPRIAALEKFTGNNNGDRYWQFAQSVAGITTTKKSNLILNVDGAIAAILLDILESEGKYSKAQLDELIEIEFFNALFVLSRSVGFTAHYLDQRRHDEGLLRLSEQDIRYLG